MVRTYQSTTVQYEAARKRTVSRFVDLSTAGWMCATFHRLLSSCTCGLLHVPILHRDTSTYMQCTGNLGNDFWIQKPQFPPWWVYVYPHLHTVPLPRFFFFFRCTGYNGVYNSVHDNSPAMSTPAST